MLFFFVSLFLTFSVPPSPSSDPEGIIPFHTFPALQPVFFGKSISVSIASHNPLSPSDTVTGRA